MTKRELIAALLAAEEVSGDGIVFLDGGIAVHRILGVEVVQEMGPDAPAFINLESDLSEEDDELPESGA
jgi:hypothetical protein